MILLRNVLNLRYLLQQNGPNPLWGSKLFSSSAKCCGALNESIRVPNRIKRSPTDVLEALASTVKQDFTSPHFKYHDDPFLTPTTNIVKKSFSLAKESGRKAAKWIIHEHPELFKHRVADPFIKAFAPSEKIVETSEVTEDLLKFLIDRVEVQKAILIYGRLKADQAEISSETQLSLLELVSFYNQEDQLDEDLIEEREFNISVKSKEKAEKTWKSNGFAEKLFQSLEPKTPEAYNALICGMANYGQVDRALEYYNQMTNEGLKPCAETYNSIIKLQALTAEESEIKWNTIMDIMKEMDSAGVRPSVQTLNACLESISTFPIYKNAVALTKQVLAEFHRIGVEPALSTYDLVLGILYKKKNSPNPQYLAEILDNLEKATPPFQDIGDVYFFSHAMEVCCYYLQDIELAERLNGLFNKTENEVFRGDSSRRQNYYRCYFTTLCRTEMPEAVMKVYRGLVPNIYSPERNVFEEILLNLKEYSAANYLPELWNDALYMDFIDRDNTMEVLLQVLATGKPSSKPFSGDVDPVLGTARAIWSHIEKLLDGGVINLRWTGTMLGNLIQVYLQFEDVESAYQVMQKLDKIKGNMQKLVPVNVLSSFVDKCIEENEPRFALMAIEYAFEVGYPEAEVMAKSVGEKIQLNGIQLTKLDSIFGRNAHKM